MGTKVSGTPCFFSVAQAALSLTPREGKELDTVLLACRPSNKTFGFFSISSPLLCSSFSCYKTTPKNQSRNSTEPSQIYAQGHYNNPFPLDSWTVYMKRCKTDLFWSVFFIRICSLDPETVTLCYFEMSLWVFDCGLLLPKSLQNRFSISH